MAYFQIPTDEFGLTWDQEAVTTTGTVLARHPVTLRPGWARKTALELVVFANQVGADVNASIRREIDSNQNRIQQLLAEIKNSHSKDEIDRLGKWLSELVELSQYLQHSYVAPFDVVEGAVHIVKSGVGPYEPTTYVVMFSRYMGFGGAMRPRAFLDLDSLRRFLIGDLHIAPEAVDQALAAIQSPFLFSGSTSIPNVVLPSARLSELGLA